MSLTFAIRPRNNSHYDFGNWSPPRLFWKISVERLLPSPASNGIGKSVPIVILNCSPTYSAVILAKLGKACRA